MKRALQLFVFFVLIGSLMAACTAAPQATPVATEPPATQAPEVVETQAPTEPPVAEKVLVTDVLDRTVEFDSHPTRIVISGKAGFMIANAAFLFPEARDRKSVV